MYLTEPSNIDDDPGLDEQPCQWCGAPADQPCAKDCRPAGADAVPEHDEAAEIMAMAVSMNERGR